MLAGVSQAGVPPSAVSSHSTCSSAASRRSRGRRLSRRPAGLQRAGDGADEPRRADGRATDHHRARARRRQHGAGVFERCGNRR